MWSAGAEVTVSGIGENGATATFGQAVPAANTVQDFVHSYRYEVVDVATGVVVNTFTQWSGFYVLPLPVTRSHTLWNLQPGTEYEVRITPINAWGKTGSAIAKRFTTAGGSGATEPTFEELAAPMPVADLLDVDFRDGVIADRSPAGRTFSDGTAAIGHDDTLDRKVATLTGSTAQAYRTAWSDADYAAIGDGFTLEAVFSVDEFSASYVDLMGNMESAGFGIEISKGSSGRATLELWTHLNGAYKVPQAANALEYGAWYHVVGTYDGAAVKLYLNGTLVGSVPATGLVKTPAPASRWLVIGGDVNGSGTPSAPFVGFIAYQRVYSDAVSTRDAAQLANRELPGLDTTEPLLRVAGEVPGTATRGATVTLPAAQAADNSGAASVTVTVTDPAGAAVALAEGAEGTRTFTPTATGDFHVVYAAVDAAGNRTESAATIQVVAPADDTAPTVTVKDGAAFTVAAPGGYELVSFKLEDAGKIDRVVLNGTVKDLTDNVWSDLNGVRPGVFGAVLGENTLVVYDVSGNATTVTFTLVEPAPVVPAEPEWDRTRVYTAGDRVGFAGAVWVAQWWTQGQEPGATGGAGAELGAEIQTASGTATAWTATWVYVGGETVVYQGRLYQAKWWTRGDKPGAAYGPWLDLGAAGI